MRLKERLAIWVSILLMAVVGVLSLFGEITDKDDPRNIPFSIYAPIIIFTIIIAVSIFFIFSNS